MVDQIIVDDSMYVGREAHVNVKLSSYTTTDHTGVSFIYNDCRSGQSGTYMCVDEIVMLTYQWRCI